MLIDNFLSVSLLSFATLALSRPPTRARDHVDNVSFGAFPTVSSAMLPSSTSKPASASASLLAPRRGRAVIVNQCSHPVYLWSVGTTVRPEAIVQPYGRYYETFRQDTGTGGIAIKISTVRHGLYSSAPMTVFAYNLSNEQVWYDLSDIFGDPFRGHPVRLQPAEPQIYWRDGVPPAGSQVRVRDASVDLVLTLC
ncbi:Antigenic thaumatin-like protein [Penicillium alfredii]|uniref:Antigenic thaumatin-like protein n=1 Tax=Penicillium alfredii TaxID=1506179 RepID=A0A9W9FS93_9EURO|nr:Antigenic thaumatin-like protein [Penicillium alfredii]KAJ5105402.1 Antigenic thaumatin-like protein [Penicillium alfredii]